MLPLPGSPAFSWAMYRQKLENALRGPSVRVATAFFLFGLLNNVFSVIILSAALDLVGPHIPKGTVLLATTLPGVITKLTLPYVIHVVPYSSRISLFSIASTISMLLIALTPTYAGSPNATEGGEAGGGGGGGGGVPDFGLAVGAKIVGILIVSISSAAGELSFLGLTHYYGNTALAAWGSGTGGAGLVGAGAYAFVTGPLGVSVRSTLLGSAIWPFGMAFAYFAVLPLGPVKSAALSRAVSRTASFVAGNGDADAAAAATSRHEGHAFDDDRDEEDNEEEDAGMLARSDQGLLSGAPVISPTTTTMTPNPEQAGILASFSGNVRRARALFFPYMLPLFIVYVGEYTINQGVAPTLLFPLGTPAAGPMRRYREFYPAYATVYQLGVFVSRSSIFWEACRLRGSLYLPALLQLGNLALLAAQAAAVLLPSVHWVFAVVFWEGLLGGAVYVNTFADILERVPLRDREFSLAATSVSDSSGILLASFVSMALELGLCAYQVRHGRDYCTRL